MMKLRSDMKMSGKSPDKRLINFDELSSDITYEIARSLSKQRTTDSNTTQSRTKAKLLYYIESNDLIAISQRM